VTQTGYMVLLVAKVTRRTGTASDHCATTAWPAGSP